MEEKFERRVEFIPAYDKRSNGYGIHNMDIRFCLIGPKGAVQWVIGSGWHTPSAREHLHTLGWPSRFDHEKAMMPCARDLGYHSPEPMYDDQTVTRDECDLIAGKCYYDGSGLNAYKLVEGFIEGGDKWLWEALEKYYRCTFEDEPWPFDNEPDPKRWRA